jgi:hypothetical protein
MDQRDTLRDLKTEDGAINSSLTAGTTGSPVYFHGLAAELTGESTSASRFEGSPTLSSLPAEL